MRNTTKCSGDLNAGSTPRTHELTLRHKGLRSTALAEGRPREKQSGGCGECSTQNSVRNQASSSTWLQPDCEGTADCKPSKQHRQGVFCIAIFPDAHRQTDADGGHGPMQHQALPLSSLPLLVQGLAGMLSRSGGRDNQGQQAACGASSTDRQGSRSSRKKSAFRHYVSQQSSRQTGSRRPSANKQGPKRAQANSIGIMSECQCITTLHDTFVTFGTTHAGLSIR